MVIGKALRRPLLLSLAIGLFAYKPAETRAADSETLSFFEEEAQVMTASRRKESVRESPVSVEVITAEDIRASGAVNLWDLLRFRAGMDVADTDEDGLAVVSIRGFARSHVRQLQVLIDGRSVYSPTRSAVDWEQLPVQLQDIERIEVVRGPGAVLFGSNAALGVVNIITKKPAGRAASAGALAGNIGLLKTEAAAENSTGGSHYRFSQTHMSREGTPQSAGGKAGDFVFSNKQNFRGSWELSPDTALDLFAGGSWDTLGNETTFGGQHRTREHFEMAKLTRRLSRGELELTASRNENAMEEEQDVGLMSLREFQYDTEALYRLDWLEERMHTVGGASYRLAVSESDQLFAGDPKQQNRIARVFISQNAELTDRIVLIGGASGEHSDTGGFEPAYQLAGVFKASEEQTFRLSYALAPSLPSLFDQRANSRDSLTRTRIGNPDLTSDHLRNYEAGYLGRFRETTTVELNLFYLDHRDLNETFRVGKIGTVTTSSFDNSDAAIARGAELTLKYQWGRAHEVYANYTYEHVTDKAGDLEVTGGAPAHKFNTGARTAWRGFSLGANLGYKDAYSIGSRSSPAYWRLDGRAAYSPRSGIELFVAGQNLAQRFHSAEFRGGEEVPRTYSGGLSVRLP